MTAAPVKRIWQRIAIIALIPMICGLTYFAYIQNEQIRSLDQFKNEQQAIITAMQARLSKTDETIKKQHVDVLHEIDTLKNTSQAIAGISVRVEKLEKSVELSSSSINETIQNTNNKMAVLSVKVEQSTSTRIDNHGAVIEKTGQKKNGFDIK